MNLKSHRQFFDGTSRPQWAGPVRSVSRQRISGLNRLAQSTEVSGLVLPVSAGTGRSQSTGARSGIGQSLGFPPLGGLLSNVHPDLLKNWGRLEQVLGTAATGLMEWDGPRGTQQAARSAVPVNALQLRAERQTLTSTKAADEGRSLRPDVISGEISKVFAIRDVSGTHLRFESAGSAASFRVTASSLHLSRDPRTL